MYSRWSIPDGMIVEGKPHKTAFNLVSFFIKLSDSLSPSFSGVRYTRGNPFKCFNLYRDGPYVVSASRIVREKRLSCCLINRELPSHR